MTKFDFEITIASVATLTVWDFYRSNEDAQAELADVQAKCIEQAKQCAGNATKYDGDSDYWAAEAGKYMMQCVDYKVMTWSDYKAAEATKLLSVPIKEITQEQFSEMMDVLPPMMLGFNRGVYSFFMSEMTTGSYTWQYAKMGGKYWGKLVDIRDKDSWIQPDMMPAQV